MSVSLLMLAKELKKNQRTIRRWCELGLIPGAYRKRSGGHWRVRKWSLKTRLGIEKRVSCFARQRTPLPENELRLVAALKRSFSPESMRRLDILLAGQGLNRQTAFTENLTEDQHHLLWETSLQDAINPSIHKVAKAPFADLHVAALKILMRSPSGKGLTASSLAKELGVCRATLYRVPFGKDRIRYTINFCSPQSRELVKPENEGNGDSLKSRIKSDNRSHNKLQREAEEEAKRIYPHSDDQMKKLLREIYPHLKLGAKPMPSSAPRSSQSPA